MLRPHVADTLYRTIGNPHADGGEACRGTPLGAVSPADVTPACGLQHRLGRNGLAVGDVALARSAGTGDGKDHRHIGRVDLLPGGDADRPPQRALSPWRKGALRP